MKIAHIVCRFNPYLAGMGNVAEEQVKRLAPENEVVVMALSNKSSDQGEVRTVSQGISYKVKWLHSLIRFSNSGFCPGILKQLKEFDIIQLHYPFFGVQEVLYWGKRLGMLKKQKLVIFYHMEARLDNIFLRFLSLPSHLIKSGLFKRADKIVCASIDYAANCGSQAVYLENKDKLVEIPFGSKYNGFKIRLDRVKQLAAELKLKPEEKMILFVANLDKAHYFKGLDVLLEAVKLLKQESLKFKLVVVGEGDLRSRYENICKQTGIEDKVIFMGRVDDSELGYYYYSCDVCVLPSINSSEAFGLALVEAKSFAKAVIGSNLPGVRGVVGDNKSGLTVKPGDSADLADKIKLILTDNSLRQRFSERAIRQANIIYDWDKHSSSLEQVYKQLMLSIL